LKEEKEEKQLMQVEMKVTKGENIIKYEGEIMARPKRTWFENEADKRAAKSAGRKELNGPEIFGKEKKGKKLSGKDKKKLDLKRERTEGKVWKKGREDRKPGGTRGGDAKGKGKSKSKAKPMQKGKMKGGGDRGRYRA
jgi:ATP-dependent RNA helicase DDX27